MQRADFLVLLFAWAQIVTVPVVAQTTQSDVPYGTNDQAGHYVQAADAKLYYERYGEGGQPVVFCMAVSTDTSTNLQK